MALLFVLLMSSQATEQKVHEWLGVAMLLIALMHQYLNFWWYQSLLKMKRNAFYLFKNTVSVLMIIALVLCIFSGFAMSKYATPFLRGAIKLSLTRQIHLCVTHWFFILVGLHIGLHLINWVKRSFTIKIKKILFVILWCVSVYGLYLFLETQMLDYLLMRSQFAFLDYKMPLWQTVGKNMVMMISWIFMSLLLANFLQQQGNAK